MVSSSAPLQDATSAFNLKGGSFTATVLDTRRSASKPELGILRWRWQLFNQHQVQVLDLEATSLFKLPV